MDTNELLYQIERPQNIAKHLMVTNKERWWG